MARAGPLLLVLLAACGGKDPEGQSSHRFDGTYEALTPGGQPVQLTLVQDGETLSGTAQVGGVEAVILGTVQGARASGTVKQAQMGFEAKFEATFQGDVLDWTYRFETDEGEEMMPLSFRRTKEAASPKVRGGATRNLDPQLVGLWYTEVGGGDASGNTVTTRIHCRLSPDGTFEFGGAESLITLRDKPLGPGDPQGTGPAATTRGRWKSEGNILSYHVDGGGWTAIGRYVLSGNDLVLYTPNGGKQLWSRE
jgi:hypothetical protein